LSDLAADILRSVGTHRCNDCGDSITVTAAAGVAEFAAYHRWLGRHERCDEIDRLRDESQAIADRRAAAEGRVAL
jgi:transcription elongation factor Elf1